MVRTVYLIDSENVADHWVGHIKLNTSLDKIIIFWSRNSRGISLWLMDAFLKSYPREQLEFVECYTGGNSMDFHIVTRLGQLTARPTKTQFVIVSDDTGYDGIINHLYDEGFSVKRLAGFKDKPQLPQLLTLRPNLIIGNEDMGQTPNPNNRSQNIGTTGKPAALSAAEKAQKAQETVSAIKWGMSEAGTPITITPQQEMAIKQNLKILFRASQYAEVRQKEITDILSTATYPSKTHMEDIYQKLCKIPRTKIKKIAIVYQYMKKSILPAIDLIMGYSNT